jgi:CHAT domain-containing protein
MVLAACWLSSTLFLPGNELVGLPAGLMRAGVGTVIASLWEVDDEANFQFMTRFYELARQRGAVWALREVQREWAQRSDTWALPFYWASYVLYGGDR